MRKILYALAFILCLSAAMPTVARAQTSQFYSLSDLKTLFVTNKAGFLITNEGFPETRAGTSLKITALNTTSGIFAGTITGTSTSYKNGSKTQAVVGRINLGSNHGGTFIWLDCAPFVDCTIANCASRGRLWARGIDEQSR